MMSDGQKAAAPAPDVARADPIKTAVERAAVKWCGDKDRETDNGDILYFKNNWSALAGLRQYVLDELAAALTAQAARIEELTDLEQTTRAANKDVALHFDVLMADYRDAERQLKEAQAAHETTAENLHRWMTLHRETERQRDEASAIIRGFMGCAELDIDERDKDPETLALETRALRFLNGATLAAIDATGESDGWLPIESAPKDGTRILVSFGTLGVREVSWTEPHTADWKIWCVDDNKHGPYALRGYSDEGPKAPSHWRPIPAPPAQGGK